MNYEPEIDIIIELSELGYVWPDPMEEMMQKDTTRVVRRCLDALTPRESKVLQMYFGVGDFKDHTLEDIGNAFNVTRERIRQILAKGLRKMRHPSLANILRQAMDDSEVLTKDELFPIIRRKNQALVQAIVPNKHVQKPVTKPEVKKEKKIEPKPKHREWVRKWENEDPDEMFFIEVSRLGWISGRKYTPMTVGVYERKANGFSAYCKWNGKKWLIGGIDINLAYNREDDKVSDFQYIDWRKVGKYENF